MIPSPSISFGVEVEVPLRSGVTGQPRSRVHRDEDKKERLRGSAGPIIKELEKREIKYTTDSWAGLNDTKSSGFKKWHICADPTTYRPWYEGVAPLEFNSPVWKANDQHEWECQLKYIEEVIDPRLAKANHDSFSLCSTHIHVSFHDYQNNEKNELVGDVPLEAVQMIALPAHLFRHVFRHLVPSRKLSSEYTMHNTTLKNIKKPEDGDEENPQEIWKKMRKLNSLKDLHKMLCWEKGYMSRLTHIRYFEWNYGGPKLMAWKTVEYRLMPSMTQKGQLATWVNFILGFISAATSIDPKNLDKAANSGDAKEIYKLYKLDKEPTEFEDIKKFILECPGSYTASEELLDEVPKIKEQTEKA